jgi:hypothetical protein
VQALAQVRLEGSVELDRMDAAHALGEVHGEDAETGADFEHHVFGPELAKRPATPRMLSSTRKCWPSSRLAQPEASREAEGRRRVGIDCVLELVAVFTPRLGQRGEGVDDIRRLVAATPNRLRREVRAVRLGQDPVRGDACRGRAKLAAFG